jgi:hypothetical protein
MSSRMWSAACAAIVFGASLGVLAQEPAAPQAGSKSSAAKTITVTGCVGKAEQGATGTSGTAGAAATQKESKFVLSNASASPSATAGTAGAETPAATAIASEYKLDGDDAKLTPHVGHKVEITGSVEESKGATQAPAASAANAPKLKVDTVKMIAASCQ